ncbi:MAG: hypothetical protein DRP08_07465 [Candidatus Aenigmatarchaeota archaeon]|nr:MAG: hypothetical protein DRP08_07465 [Candidatus Aenigmarchaeota archaeon]
MKGDKIKIINEMDGDIVVRVGVTVFAEEKHVSLSKEIDLMKEIPVDKADELIIKIRKKED